MDNDGGRTLGLFVVFVGSSLSALVLNTLIANTCHLQQCLQRESGNCCLPEAKWTQKHHSERTLLPNVVLMPKPLSPQMNGFISVV